MLTTLPRPRGLGAVRRTWARNPRAALALRAAVSAGLAWYVAQLLPGPAADYPYYAPMGAVVATTFTLAGSVRESLRAVAAIVLGGAVATGADLVGTESSPVVIAVAVAVGVGLAGLPWLGAMGSWVPTAALFTLVIGRGEAYYVGAYGGLTLLGAAIGVAVTLLVPTLPLAPAQEALGRVRASLAAGLTDVAEALERDDVPTPEDWERLRPELQPAVADMRAAMTRAEESVRGNRRARRYDLALITLRAQRSTYLRLVNLLEDLLDMLATQERAGLENPALGPVLRPAAADVLRGLAEALDTVTGTRADAAAVQEARDRLGELAEAVERSRRADVTGGGVLAAGGLIMTVGRALDAVDPGRGAAQP